MTNPAPSDAATIAQFVRTHPASCAHVVDLPYRLCSPSAQDPRNLRVWHDDAGEAIGFAIVQREFSALDWAVQPQHPDLREAIFRWAVQRLQAIRAERAEDFGFLIGSRDPIDRFVAGAEFIADDWAMRHLSMPLSASLSEPQVPDGVRIRPLAGLAEVDAYVALHRSAFGSRNMTIEWRTRTLSHPAYDPSLDFVAEDQEGKLLAFCIGWKDIVQGTRIGQIEPLGVLPDAQKRGIGRAILLSVLQRMRTSGCEFAEIDAESTNSASNHLYESAGFTERFRSHQFFRSF